jgi:hypothetical protein
MWYYSDRGIPSPGILPSGTTIHTIPGVLTGDISLLPSWSIKQVAMKKIILTGMMLLCTFMNNYAQTDGVKTAEDLWGNHIGFDRIIHDPVTTIIQPFSPSNCGYCMVDGWFVEKNYFENNRFKGGVNFTQCLFNPQLDIYAFTRHYRDTLTPVLTYPPELHQYHQDGFPVILAFRDGQQVVKLPEGLLAPYDSSFEQLKMKLWNDTSIRFKPVSDLHFATRIIYENMNYSAICIVSDGNKASFDANTENAKRNRCYRVKYLSQVTNEDLVRDIIFEGRFNRDVYGFFTSGNSPLKTEGDSVLCIGDYRLGIDTIGISACIPNPVTPSKYTVIKIRGMKVAKGFFDNSVDYTIYTYDEQSSAPHILLHGFFDKQENGKWLFDNSRCISNLPAGKNCVRTCSLPVSSNNNEHPVDITGAEYKMTARGEEYTFGNGSCRFPAVVMDDQGTAWVCWEEKGDILLSSVERKQPVTVAIEHDATYSYNPVITFAEGKIWVFYLNNRDGFYRVYGRCFDGTGLSAPLLCSDLLPCDAVTPSVAAGKEGITLAWTLWKSNFRYPFYREIRNGVPGDVHPIIIAGSDMNDGYINAWYINLTADADGKVWGAWNQHYPAILGVASGNLDGPGISVTGSSPNIYDSENGGYPSPVNDKQGRRWVFWESAAWDVPEGGKQQIMYSAFNDTSGSWSPSISLPVPEGVYLNQTPRAATLSDGRICVVWSGRTKEDNWALYLACRENDKWTGPVQLTSGKEPARAPSIIADGNNSAWISWHDGTGDGMKVKIIRLSANLF